MPCRSEYPLLTSYTRRMLVVVITKKEKIRKQLDGKHWLNNRFKNRHAKYETHDSNSVCDIFWFNITAFRTVFKLKGPKKNKQIKSSLNTDRYKISSRIKCHAELNILCRSFTTAIWSLSKSGKQKLHKQNTYACKWAQFVISGVPTELWMIYPVVSRRSKKSSTKETRKTIVVITDGVQTQNSKE